MSLTTVAAPVQPDETLPQLPPSRPERFQRSDFIAAGLVFFITLGVYIATLAPNVTLEDSGELITAAAKFGVGHPPGYPLWTMSGFLLSHLLPFGNLAWRINLLSALFGARGQRGADAARLPFGPLAAATLDGPGAPAGGAAGTFSTSGLLAGLVIGFSDVMWSQAVIAAVHGTLNALFVNLVLLFFYLWMLEPRRRRYRLILAVFVFALGPDQSPHAGPDHSRLPARRGLVAIRAGFPAEAHHDAPGAFLLRLPRGQSLQPLDPRLHQLALRR